MTSRAIVLARGLGRRMQAGNSPLSGEQRAAADAGLKPMMPIGGRPFLDYVLSSLADAGVLAVALVVAPDHDAIRRRYVTDCPPSRIRIDFVEQTEPTGTAAAVVSAESWTSGEPFLVVNGDNLYPAVVLRELARQEEAACPAFRRDELVRDGNILVERVQEFALLDLTDDGYVLGIVEKPSAARLATAGSTACVSMNCWRFDLRIFTFCREVPASARNEFELPEAVGLAIARGVTVKAFRGHGAVLDLSTRGDIAAVERRLAGVTPRP
ncbi:MAG: nucleotidyltransferase family protein [Acidobacteria bacterium]|nr:nucleotidyltransferase family protein [Acidobacteriota bacterium]